MLTIDDFFNSLINEIDKEKFKENLNNIFKLFNITFNNVKPNSYYYFFLNTSNFYQKNLILKISDVNKSKFIYLQPLDKLKKNDYILSLKKFTKILEYQIETISLYEFKKLNYIFTRLSNKETSYYNILSLQEILVTDKNSNKIEKKYVINCQPKIDYLVNGYNTLEFYNKNITQINEIDISSFITLVKRKILKNKFKTPLILKHNNKYIYVNNLTEIPNKIQLTYNLGYIIGLLSLPYLWYCYKDQLINSFIFSDRLINKNFEFKKYKFKVSLNFNNKEILLLNKIINIINDINSNYNVPIIYYYIKYNYKKDYFTIYIESPIILLIIYSLFYINSKYDEKISISMNFFIRYFLNKEFIEGYLTGFSDINLTDFHLKLISNKPYKNLISRIYSYYPETGMYFIFLTSFLKIPFIYNRVPMWDYSNISKEIVTEMKPNKRVYYKFIINRNSKKNAYRRLKSKNFIYEYRFMKIFYNKKIIDYIKNGFNIIFIRTRYPNIVLSDGTVIYGVKGKFIKNLLNKN